MKQLFIVLFAIFTAASSVLAQGFARDNRLYYDYGSPCAAILYQNPEGTKVFIALRTANMLFSFVRTEKQRQHLGAFYAVRDINIEIRDKASGAVTSAMSKRDTLYANDYDATISANINHSFIGMLPLDAEFSNELEVRCDIRDGMLSRMAYYPLTQSFSRFIFRPALTGTPADTAVISIGDIYLYDEDHSGEKSFLVSYNIGGEYPFSAGLRGVIPIAYPPHSEPPALTLTLRQTGSFIEQKLKTPIEHVRILIPSSDIRQALTIEPTVFNDSGICLTPRPANDSIASFALAFFEIPNLDLPLGNYHFEISASDGKVSKKQTNEYRLVWKNMPVSLTDIRTALPPLRYIVSDDEYQFISSGSDVEQFRKIFSYWKKRDPTPNTAYNELMAEFYSRVDYANHNYARSPRQPDGSTTDRGRVYIHYGKPTNIARTFLIGEPPTEIWTYENAVKKVFIFTDESSNGNYRLVEERQF